MNNTPKGWPRISSALSDSTRRAVVDLLSTQPRRAGELAEALDMGAPGVSQHTRNGHPARLEPFTPRSSGASWPVWRRIHPYDRVVVGRSNEVAD